MKANHQDLNNKCPLGSHDLPVGSRHLQCTEVVGSLKAFNIYIYNYIYIYHYIYNYICIILCYVILYYILLLHMYTYLTSKLMVVWWFNLIEYVHVCYLTVRHLIHHLMSPAALRIGRPASGTRATMFHHSLHQLLLCEQVALDSFSSQNGSSWTRLLGSPMVHLNGHLKSTTSWWSAHDFWICLSRKAWC